MSPGEQPFKISMRVDREPTAEELRSERSCFTGCKWWHAAKFTDGEYRITCCHPEEAWTVPAWGCPYWEDDA